jgi:hypothetical protein
LKARVCRWWHARSGRHVVERYTPLSPDALSYEANIEDPKVFSRPSIGSAAVHGRVHVVGSSTVNS